MGDYHKYIFCIPICSNSKRKTLVLPPKFFKTLQLQLHNTWSTVKFEETNSCWSPMNSIVGKEILWSQWGLSTVWLPAFFKISSFVQHRKEIHTGLERHEGTEHLKGHGGGKNLGWVETFFFGFSRKLLCSLEKLCVSSQNFCVLSQRYLRSLAKPVEFGQTLPVYFTACNGYSSVCS